VQFYTKCALINEFVQLYNHILYTVKMSNLRKEKRDFQLQMQR